MTIVTIMTFVIDFKTYNISHSYHTVQMDDISDWWYGITRLVGLTLLRQYYYRELTMFLVIQSGDHR